MIKETVNGLDSQIKAQEDAEKLEKENKVRLHFDELVKAHKIDFITFEDANLNITLTATEKEAERRIRCVYRQSIVRLTRNQ